MTNPIPTEKLKAIVAACELATQGPLKRWDSKALTVDGERTVILARQIAGITSWAGSFYPAPPLRQSSSWSGRRSGLRNWRSTLQACWKFWTTKFPNDRTQVRVDQNNLVTGYV